MYTQAVEIPPKEIKDPYPYKLIRVLPDKMSYIVIDTSKGAERLEKALAVLKKRKNPPPGKYMIVHITLNVIAE